MISTFGLLTGDDEQSDFFFEPGPACGIPGIIPWWENESGAGATGGDKDPRFEQILNGSFQHLSQAAKSNFKYRLKQLTKVIISTHNRFEFNLVTTQFKSDQWNINS